VRKGELVAPFQGEWASARGYGLVTSAASAATSRGAGLAAWLLAQADEPSAVTPRRLARARQLLGCRHGQSASHGGLTMSWSHTVGGRNHHFADLKTLLARATPQRSGDVLAGIAAESAGERMAARCALADLPLAAFVNHAVVPYEDDEVTRLIIDSHDAAAFAPVAHLTVGGLRDWLLSEAAGPAELRALAPGLLPEMAAAVSKLMRNQDLIVVARKCHVTTAFRNTIGLPGHLAVRLQPNHPTDDLRGIAASMLDGLLYGSGDAVIGINPATDSLAAIGELLRLLDQVIHRHAIPTQGCVLTHVPTHCSSSSRACPSTWCSSRSPAASRPTPVSA
jgi:ethanolamine ammonia-lyase large subunit